MGHNIRLLSSRAILFLAFLVAVLIPVATTAAENPPPPAMKVLSTEEALQVDAQTIAANQGWDEAATLAVLNRQEVTGAFVAGLAETYPNTFGGAWTGDGPNDELSVRFVGPVPSEAQAQAKEQGIAVTFIGGAKQSLTEIQARADRVHADLVDHGFPEIASGILIQTENIVATAMRPQGNKLRDQDLLNGLSPESLASDVEITFADGPIVELHDTYGGDRVFVSGGDACTSGFTVYRGTEKGVTSAGHCSFINRYRQENGFEFGLQWRNAHEGTWGDFEWYTSPTSTVFPRFYSNTGIGRDQKAVAGAATIVARNQYCMFGRNSGYHCDEVRLTSVSVTSEGKTYSKLVATNREQGMPGDSGGPWFIGTTAVGTFSGAATFQGIRSDFFAKADYLDEAISVNVLIAP